MTTNSRQTRTAGNTDAATVEPANAKNSRAFMDPWVEPPIRPLAPSFMEYPHMDIVRHGVLENMAPLGTMPSSKVRKLAKTEGPRRVTLVRKGGTSASAASTPREAVTPEPPIIPSRRRSESNKTEEVEWVPTTPIGQTSTRKNTPRESVSLPPMTSPYSTSVSPSKPDRELQITDRIVDFACREAQAAGRIHTHYALRSFYDDHRNNPRILRLIDLVATQEATDEEVAEFSNLMKYKKKEGRTDGKSQQFFARSDKSFTNSPILFSPIQFNLSLKNPVAETAVNETASRSSHRESRGHIHKKHKGNSYKAPRENTPEMKVNGKGGTMNGSTNRHLRSRSNSSISSDSDLSSVDAELLETEESFAPSGQPSPSQAQAAQASQASQAETWPDTTTTDDLHSHAPAQENQTQPMTRQKGLGQKPHAWVDSSLVSSASSSTTAPNNNHHSNTKSPVRVSSLANHNNHTNNMPARLTEPFLPQPPETLSSSQHPQNQPTLKSLKKGAAGAARTLDEDDRRSQLTRAAKKTTENSACILESNIRTQLRSRDPESDLDGRAVASQPHKLRLLSSRVNKKFNDESDDLSSPTLLSFQPDVVPGSSTNSRAGTPGILNRPTRKPKSGLRMKTSPMKKKAGPSAGIPRASGERNSPVANGTLPNNQDDNDDYCSSCGGNGDLVCCDGCTRSFHFKCVDPPLNENQLPDNWFCNACNSLRNPVSCDDSNLFGQLLAILQKKNPSAFHLPKDIREYFENVRTGTEGEYEEGILQKPKRNAGYEEAPDYLKLKDAKGNFILCHECHEGAGTGNSIISCSYCGLHWHLDCLDPPLANPPPLGKLWRCPCHVDDLLAMLPGSLGPAHRFRKIKGASVMKPVFSRGFKNDGHIDVELAPSEDEDEGFFDQKEYGRVYKLPEEGIKLDFISRIKARARPLAIPTPPPEFIEEPIKQAFTIADRRSILEQQAALNFAQFASQSGAPDGAQLLIDALLAEAPSTVVAMVAQGDASNIASHNLGRREKQSLLAMKALIEQQLKQMEEVEDGDVKVENGLEKQGSLDIDVDMEMDL